LRRHTSIDFAFCALDDNPVYLPGAGLWLPLLGVRSLGRKNGPVCGINLGQQYGAKPGLVSGIFRSPTEFAALCPRVFMVYPLSQLDGKMKTKDWKKVPNFPTPSQRQEKSWVNPETFFDQLPEILNKVPPLPGEETTTVQFAP